MYPKEMNTVTPMPHLYIYAHVMDVWSVLGKVKGQLCLFGRKALRENKVMLEACGKLPGYSGPQLLYDGPSQARVFGSEPEEWEKYLADLTTVREALRTCLHF